MFQTPVSLHIARVSMKTETNNDVTTPVVAVGLMLEPLTRALARELSPEIADHCFTKDGAIRDEISNFTVKLREPQQYIEARMAEDSTVNTTLRHVRAVALSVTKRGEVAGEAVEKKSKKIGPTAEILRATVHMLVVPDDTATREFLMRRFGSTFYFAFEDEKKQLPFGPAPEEDDDEDDDEAETSSRLKFEAPAPDPAAGDVLEEKPKRAARRKSAEFKNAPRLAKGKAKK